VRDEVTRARKKLDKFEKLIRDAIALLIKRGEMSIPERSHSLQTPKAKKKNKVME